MAAVPREAAEFIRMLVRAFYPEHFAPIIDGILTRSNFVSHDELSKALHLNPRELRKKMHRLAMTKLVKSETRQQKKINYADERQPVRTVHTEFWFVPLHEVLDAFQYRVDIIERELESEVKAEEAHQWYVCSQCKTTYKLLDIINNMSNDGSFICDRVDFRTECGGQIIEQDNRKKLRESESLKTMFHDQLRPLRVLVASCLKLKIPAHPLEGVDEKTWGELVPETVGVNRTVAAHDEEERIGTAAREQDVEYQIQIVTDEQRKPSEEESDKGKITEAMPEKPEWFKEDMREDEDDWDVTENVQASDDVAKEKGQEDHEIDAYYQKFVEKNLASAAQEQGENEREGEEKRSSVSGAENLRVIVGGVQYRQEEITDELVAKMTTEEYQDYFNKMRSHEEDDSDADMFD